MTENISEQQAEQLVREMMKEKSNVISFFTDIIKAEETTKTGNLTLEELGEPKIPLRSLKELQLFSEQICVDEGWKLFFKDSAEILTASSLSKDGLLVKLSVTSKKELADLSPKEIKKNKGWFSKKNE